MNKILTEDFFNRDVLEVAPELVGKIIVRRLDDGTVLRERISETEAYRGVEDKACHASKGRKRSDLCISLLWYTLAYEYNYRRKGTASGSAYQVRRNS